MVGELGISVDTSEDLKREVQQDGEMEWDTLKEIQYAGDDTRTPVIDSRHERPDWMTMGEDRRIEEAYNQVGSWDGPAFGKNIPYALSTNMKSVYRVTGDSQVEDILDCGYVRPGLGKRKGGSYNKTCWSQGGDKLFYYDRRPVIQASTEKVKNGQIGAIPLENLEAIYIFDDVKQEYVNALEEIREAFAATHGSKQSLESEQKSVI